MLFRSPRQLCVLKSLWECREALAQQSDLPAYRILPSEILLRFAMHTPQDGYPERVPTLPSRLAENIKLRLQTAYEIALEIKPDAWPQPLKSAKKPPKSPNAELLKNLKAMRDEIATELGLDPSLLINRSNLTAVALTDCASPEKIREAAHWMKWQEDLLLPRWINPIKPTV